MQIAVGNNANNNICIMTPVPGGNVIEAANKYFGENPYDVIDGTNINLVDGYLPAYFWNLETHALNVNMDIARACRMVKFEKMRCDKWKADGLPHDPNQLLINLFTGQPKNDLESMKAMESLEVPILDTKNTIAELEAYTPFYLL